MVRVRFAPSPTGHLHIGGVRTALFNYLYARAQKGSFLIRIEDTDQIRSKKEFEDEILKALSWLGFQWDEGIIRQSDRLGKYRELAEHLVQTGAAYHENNSGQTAIKFKIPKQQGKFYDLVHGETPYDSQDFEDLVLIKSDGYPAFHWACVVDDHDMQITHVIRGDDHLSNTPRQLMLFEAMGWKPPKYGHLPLILGEDGTPLSKRHGAVSLSAFKENGFIPEGMINYLALLGWSAGSSQEFFRLEDLIKNFSLKRINKAGARFDYDKLCWMNAQHIKQLEENDFFARLQSFYPSEAEHFGPEKWRKVAALFRIRIRTFRELKEQALYLFESIAAYDSAALETYRQKPGIFEVLKLWCERVQTLVSFSPKEIETLTRQLADEKQISAAELIHPLRFAITGQTISPGLFELMDVMGKSECLARIRTFLASSH